jgi:hypothetical protein
MSGRRLSYCAFCAVIGASLDAFQPRSSAWESRLGMKSAPVTEKKEIWLSR